MQIPRSTVWLFGLITWLLTLWTPDHPEQVEKWYSRGLFQPIRWLYDHLLGWQPVPGFWWFWAAIIGYWIWKIIRRPRQLTWPRKILHWALEIIRFALALVALFYWLWAFNYHRKPIAEQLGLHPAPLDSVAIWQELYAETRALDSLRMLVTSDTMPINDARYEPPHMQDTLRAALKKWLSDHNFPASGNVRVRSLQPQGILLRFSTLGIYWPFAGEGNMDDGAHPLQKPSVIPHEMSHGYGFGDEGICNFIAYAACYRHANPYIAYTNRLAYWRTLASTCMEQYPYFYLKSFRPNIPPGIRQDERAIRAQMARFKDLMPETRYAMYDAYLKSQGVKSGMLSYDEVLMLVYAMKHHVVM